MCVWFSLQNIHACIIFGPTVNLKGHGDLFLGVCIARNILRKTIINPRILVFRLLSTAGIYNRIQSMM